MVKKHFLCIKVTIVALLVLTYSCFFVVTADTSSIVRKELAITWPINNEYYCDGEEKVYSPTVEDDYIELKWIDSDGNQYIKTDIIAYENSRFVFENFTLLTNPSNWALLFGISNGSYDNTKTFNIRRVNNTNYIGFGIGYLRFDGNHFYNYQTPLIVGSPYNIDFSKKGVIVNGTLLTDKGVEYNTFEQSNFGISIFGLTHDAGTPTYSASPPERLSRFTAYSHYNDTNPSADLIPAMRISDGTIGMYDIVSKTFFENDGGGNFIAGPFKYGLYEDKVHDFEVVDSITDLPEKFSDSKYVPIHIKNQETGGPSAGYYIYDSSTDTIWGKSDSSGSSAVSFDSGGSMTLAVYKEIDTKKTEPDDYTAKVELTGLGKIYFKLPSNSSHGWKIKNRIVPTFNAYNGYYDGQEHGITSYSFKDEDGNVLNDVSIKFNTDGSSTYSIEYDDLPKYIDIGTYKIYYQATKTNYKTTTGYVNIVIKPKPSNNKKGKYKLPSTGVE